MYNVYAVSYIVKSNGTVFVAVRDMHSMSRHSHN
jgi:hypothetical protein